MTVEWGEIYTIMQTRRDADPDLFRTMEQVKARYEGDIVVPLPDVEGDPELPSAMPMLVADAIDNNAMRAASTRPIISTPKCKNTKTSERRKEDRRKAWYGRWYESGLSDMLMGRAYRHWFGYGTACIMAKPRLQDYEYDGAKIVLHDPMTVYPEARNADDHRQPQNIGIVYGVSREWLTRRFPEKTLDLFNSKRYTVTGETLWDVVEWWDNEDRVMGLLGPRQHYGSAWREDFFGSGSWIGRELKRTPNRAEMVPGVAPRRITLGKISSQVEKMMGLNDLMGKMYALEYLQAEKAVFPDMVVIGQDGQAPQLVHGRWVDGREGEVNLVTDAQSVDLLRSESAVSSWQTTDRLERAARINGGASPLFGGESAGASLRTGAALNSAASFSIDPRIQEANRVMARHLSTLNEAIAKVEMGWFKGKKLWTYSGWIGEDEKTEYHPEDTYETCLNVVSYPMPGADVSQMNIILAQLNASGLLSKSSARAKHPLIDDPEDESRTDVMEQVQSAQLAGLLQRASAGEIPEIDLANLYKKLGGGMDLAEAIIEVQEEAQERQAQEAEGPQEGQAMAPGQMPGLANPGVGAEQQPPSPAGAGDRIQSTSDSDLNRLRQLMYDVNFSGTPARQ